MDTSASILAVKIFMNFITSTTILYLYFFQHLLYHVLSKKSPATEQTYFFDKYNR